MWGDQWRCFVRCGVISDGVSSDVEVISKFAQLEFRFGEPERGKTMFDHLLATYPRRLDQWNVYLGQLMKSADYEAAR